MSETVDLRPFGYAPGDYMITCHHCGERWIGAYERATACRPCAEKRLAEYVPPAPTRLTERQKLQALAMKYYSGIKWEPKTGDHYTTCRDDLELYQVIEATDAEIVTMYCDPAMSAEPTRWTKDEFLAPGTFGVFRVWVHPCLLGAAA